MFSKSAGATIPWSNFARSAVIVIAIAFRSSFSGIHGGRSSSQAYAFVARQTAFVFIRGRRPEIHRENFRGSGMLTFMAFRICKTIEIENGHMLSKHPDKCRFPHGHSRRVEF